MYTIYVVKSNNRIIARTTSSKANAQQLARNLAKTTPNVRLFKLTGSLHISTALPRPTGERHTKGAR